MSGTILLTAGYVMAFLVVRLAGFLASQALIGLGWNLCFVAATAAFTKQLRPRERARAQSANDVAVFVTSGTCMVVAAPCLQAMGWVAMQYIGLATSGLMLLALAISELLEMRRSNRSHTQRVITAVPPLAST